MYIGVDVGTSGIKALIIDPAQRIVASHTEKLETQSPHRGWSEQAPEAWWRALSLVFDVLSRQAPEAMRAVRSIGLSGQQHGAVLLDADRNVLRPCILWNDTRASLECAELETLFPQCRAVTGNIPVAGFTAPKILWVRRHEADIFARLRHVLLPKAWLRLQLSGEMIEDLSDASGTLWLDVQNRRWSGEALAACGLTTDAMPRLVEGSAPGGSLLPEYARRWGMREGVMIAGGAGDNAAAAIGLGAIDDGDRFVSLGSSGVVWRTTQAYRADTEHGIHAFCHAIPDRWHQMGVTLSAAACLNWWSDVTGMKEEALLAELPERVVRPARPIFLPYLSGERTPHRDGLVRGAFLGLDRDVARPELTQAVLEGVAFSLRDAAGGLDMHDGGVRRVTAIGGGSKSSLWMSIIATVMEVNLANVKEGDYGGAFGAARLAYVASGDGEIGSICQKPDHSGVYAPDAAHLAHYREKYALYQKSYPLVRQWAEYGEKARSDTVKSMVT